MAYRDAVALNRKLNNDVKKTARRAKKRGRTLGGIGKTLAMDTSSRRSTQEKRREGKWEQEELGALCLCVTCKDLPFTVLLNWHHKAAEKWSGVHASTSTPSHTHGKLRDATKQRKALKGNYAVRLWFRVVLYPCSIFYCVSF